MHQRSTPEQPLEPLEDVLEHPCPPGQESITRALTLLLAAACGVTVANLYYNQPLLADMARAFGAGAAAIGAIPTLTQVGYAVGLLFLVPLGDLADRRKLVTVLLVLVTAALVATGLARNLPWLAAASFAVGVTTVVPQILIPYGAQLSRPEQRGKTVGTIMSGLLAGILLSRTLSGLIGDHAGWRTVYYLAAGLMILVALALRGILPAGRGKAELSYPSLLHSLLTILRQHPILRHAALNGALMFACFSAFWATLVFRLAAPPYHLGAQAAGLFGLVGAGGAMIAPLAGRFADRAGPRSIITIASTLMALSFVVLWTLGAALAGLVAGTVLLDVAATAGMISNQTRIYSLPHPIHSRVNTVYMVSYFVGGAAGSMAGAAAYARFAWPGVCAVGIAVALVAVAAHLATIKSDREEVTD